MNFTKDKSLLSFRNFLSISTSEQFTSETYSLSDVETGEKLSGYARPDMFYRISFSLFTESEFNPSYSIGGRLVAPYPLYLNVCACPLPSPHFINKHN